MPPVVVERGEVVRVSGISELVQIDDRRRFLRQPMMYEMRSDESRAASDQYRIYVVSFGWNRTPTQNATGIEDQPGCFISRKMGPAIMVVATAMMTIIVKIFGPRIPRS